MISRRLMLTGASAWVLARARLATAAPAARPAVTVYEDPG
jgi:hypothetical protein